MDITLFRQYLADATKELDHYKLSSHAMNQKLDRLHCVVVFLIDCAIH